MDAERRRKQQQCKEAHAATARRAARHQRELKLSSTPHDEKVGCCGTATFACAVLHAHFLCAHGCMLDMLAAFKGIKGHHSVLQHSSLHPLKHHLMQM